MSFVRFKDYNESVIANCSDSHLISIDFGDISMRTFNFHVLSQTDYDVFNESLGIYGNSYYSELNYLKGAKVIVDKSPVKTNTIYVENHNNASIYDGWGVLSSYNENVGSGRSQYNVIISMSFYWLGASQGTEIQNGVYRI